jgi:hypothetical protein
MCALGSSIALCTNFLSCFMVCCCDVDDSEEEISLLDGAGQKTKGAYETPGKPLKEVV